MMNILLWILQAILAIIFIMAGLMKASQPKDKLMAKVGGWVRDYDIKELKLIGYVEILGAIALILPMLFNILPVLTPIAAFGIAIMMIFAAKLHAKRSEKKETRVNLLLLLLSLIVAIGRIV